MRSKKTNAKQAIETVHVEIASEIAGLQNQRDQSLSMFRQIAECLATINESLRQKLDDLASLESFIKTQQECATKTISDNDRVYTKIMDIIGD